MAKTTRFSRVATVMLSLLIFVFATHADASPTKRAVRGNPRYAAITIDAQTGRVLSESNADKLLFPASLTKMMTLFLTFEALDSGRLHENKFLTVSRRAINQPPSKLGLREGEHITVKQAIQALVTRSANDVAVAMAETVGGSEANFARMMTERARSLGMKNTTFYNPHGLPNPNQKTTVRDMATLGRALMQYFPHHYHYFNTVRFNYKGRTIETHNNLMKRFKGMDGLKTGYTYASGFNLAASAVRNNRRVIVVVFGGRTANSRDAHVASLINQGFAQLDRSQMNTQFASAKTPPAIAPIRTQVVKSLPTESLQARKPDGNIVQANYTTNTTTARTWAPDGGTVRPLASIGNASYNPSEQKKWGIQVGAFASAALGLKALQTAKTNLGNMIHQQARAIVVPQRTRKGVIYRARILDLSAQNAAQACARLDDCMAFTVK